MKKIILFAVSLVVLCGAATTAFAAGTPFIQADMMCTDTEKSAWNTELSADTDLAAYNVLYTSTLGGYTDFYLRTGQVNTEYGSARIVTGAGEAENSNALVLTANSAETSSSRVVVQLRNQNQGSAYNNPATYGMGYMIHFNASELQEDSCAEITWIGETQSTTSAAGVANTKVYVKAYKDKFVISAAKNNVPEMEYSYPTSDEWHELVIYANFDTNANAIQVFMDGYYITSLTKNSKCTAFREVEIKMGAAAKNSVFKIDNMRADRDGNDTCDPTVTTTDLKITDGEGTLVTEATASGDSLSEKTAAGATLTAAGMTVEKNTSSNGAVEFCQWGYSDTKDGIYRPIPGATSAAYTVDETYAGRYIQFRYGARDKANSSGIQAYAYGQTYRSDAILVVPEDGLVYMPAATVSSDDTEGASALALLEDSTTITPTATITNYGDAKDDAKYMLLAAIYHNDELKMVKRSDEKTGLSAGENTVSAEEMAFTISELGNGDLQDYTLKLFLWNGAGSLVPLCDDFAYYSTYRLD